MKPTLVIIPARKGSKGVVGKNVRELAGKPLIAYSIEAALGCRRKLDILVSTNDPKVREIALSYGLSTDYARPEGLATDEAGMAEVLIDGIEWLEARGKTYEQYVLLQPTSPFRTSKDIDEGLDLLERSGAPTVVGVSPMLQHPFECVKVEGDRWEFLVEKPTNLNRRQQYTGKFHFINGALYCGNWQYFRENKKFMTSESRLQVMDVVNSVDIDTELEFQIADVLMRYRKKEI